MMRLLDSSDRCLTDEDELNSAGKASAHANGCSNDPSNADQYEVIAEICLKPSSDVDRKAISTTVHRHLVETSSTGTVTLNCLYRAEDLPASIQSSVLSVRLCCEQITDKHENGSDSEVLGGADGVGDEAVPAAQYRILPSVEFEGLWESLYFEGSVKENLLNYVSMTLMLSDADVDPNIISWNRVVLLHGPPGTGKTSLCQALAHKLAIRHCERYHCAQLVEINSHSLFSRWFSESGKLVLKMFQSIRELIEDTQSLVVVLIDEVESISGARKAALNGSEPSDSIRVVNALLTQIDQIKRFPNVIVLTTSNVTEGIDLAFIDRADIKQYIGPPRVDAIYDIMRGCCDELVRCGFMEMAGSPEDGQRGADSFNSQLRAISEKAIGLSGRALRKLPLHCLAHHLRCSRFTGDAFLEALQLSVAALHKESAVLSSNDLA